VRHLYIYSINHNHETNNVNHKCTIQSKDYGLTMLVVVVVVVVRVILHEDDDDDDDDGDDDELTTE